MYVCNTKIIARHYIYFDKWIEPAIASSTSTFNEACRAISDDSLCRFINVNIYKKQTLNLPFARAFHHPATAFPALLRDAPNVGAKRYPFPRAQSFVIRQEYSLEPWAKLYDENGKNEFPPCHCNHLFM